LVAIGVGQALWGLDPIQCPTRGRGEIGAGGTAENRIRAPQAFVLSELSDIGAKNMRTRLVNTFVFSG
jgi:hypothetical protein